jgi:Mn2+/Fe2+ NRAMP family transporter
MKKILLSFIFFAFTLILTAQDSASATNEEPTTGMRSNEKIYVVVAVLGTVLAGLFVYVIRLDKKISRMEKGEK